MNLSLGLRVSDGRFADVRRAFARIGTAKELGVQTVLADAARRLSAQARRDQERGVVRRVAVARLHRALEAGKASTTAAKNESDDDSASSRYASSVASQIRTDAGPHLPQRRRRRRSS
jgi:hypothetical protein